MMASLWWYSSCSHFPDLGKEVLHTNTETGGFSTLQKTLAPDSSAFYSAPSPIVTDLFRPITFILRWNISVPMAESIRICKALKGLISRKMMWITCGGLYSFQTTTQLNTSGEMLDWDVGHQQYLNECRERMPMLFWRLIVANTLLWGFNCKLPYKFSVSLCLTCI